MFCMYYKLYLTLGTRGTYRLILQCRKEPRLVYRLLSSSNPINNSSYWTISWVSSQLVWQYFTSGRFISWIITVVLYLCVIVVVVWIWRCHWHNIIYRIIRICCKITAFLEIKYLWEEEYPNVDDLMVAWRLKYQVICVKLTNIRISVLLWQVSWSPEWSDSTYPLISNPLPSAPGSFAYNYSLTLS